jgi:hypothetical protein
VGAWSGDDWVAQRIAENGGYRLEVAAGLWHLDYRIDPTSYAKAVGVRTVPVEAGQTSHVNLPVLAKDGTITGQVLNADGSPARGARVAARGLVGLVNDLWFFTVTGSDGNFRLKAPYGLYGVGAAARGQDIWPVEHEVTVPPGGTVALPEPLQFRVSDATLTGTLTLSNSVATGAAYVWAFSDDGGFVKGTAALDLGTGGYRLDVISGTTWHVRALFATSSQYWFGRGSVAVTSDAATLDLTLEGPKPKPGPVVVQFDASEAQSLALNDGTDLYIPAGALPATGRVTLRIEPIVTLTGHRGADVFRYGYAFLATDEGGEPITAHFNQDVIIRFPYDEAELARLGIRENRLRPAYFSTTTNSWSYPESYVVDADANVVTMQVDHFTDFALTAQSALTELYLPLVRH